MAVAFCALGAGGVYDGDAFVAVACCLWTSVAVAFGALCPSARAPFVALCMAPPAVAPPASSAAALTSASSSLLEAGKRGKSV